MYASDIKIITFLKDILETKTIKQNFSTKLL